MSWATNSAFQKLPAPKPFPLLLRHRYGEGGGAAAWGEALKIKLTDNS